MIEYGGGGSGKTPITSEEDIAGGRQEIRLACFVNPRPYVYTDEGYLCLFFGDARRERGYMGCAVITRLKKR